jgi:hypothetical protein
MQMDHARNSRTVLAGICLFAFTSPLWAGDDPASVGRTQSFSIGALNRVEWAGGIGSARGEAQASFSQTQQVTDRHGSLSVRQSARGSFSQTATAGGTGYGLVRQTAAIRGSQDLLTETGRYPSSRAQQQLEAKLTMYLFRPNGVGTVSGTQSYNGLQEQVTTNTWGTSSQWQSVDIKQSGSISTQTNVDPTVRNTITVDLRQSQSTSGH